MLAIVIGTAAFVSSINWMGLLQTSEQLVLDHFFHLRPLEPPDSRILIVTISDEDIHKIGAWPIPDQVLAKALVNLNAQKPRVIGLDLYRDLPVEPGHQELTQTFKSMPNLLGIQFGLSAQKVPPPPVLAQLNQVADANIPEDPDKRVRRAMLTGQNGDQAYLGLGLAAALKYLEKEKVHPISIADSPDTYQLGRAKFERLHGNDGGYTRIDDNGYQILLNFRGPASTFQTISFMDALHNRIPEKWLRDRVVLLGTTAESVKDIFLTPYSTGWTNRSEWTSGVVIHANIVSQILSAALDGRPLLHGFPGSLRWLWVLGGASIGVSATWNILQTRWINKQYSYGAAMLGIFIVSGGLVAIGYALFLQGWWVPVATPILALNTAAIACFAYYSYTMQRLAYMDELTQVANRRYFDLCLAGHVQRKGNLSLILCDVDCFKRYNDTYGHQAGDECLAEVGRNLRDATRRTDFVARYGGEEFVVILPNTNAREASIVAERVVSQMRALQIPHESSTASSYVTLSCGVAHVMIDEHLLKSSDWSGATLIAQADKALYVSKENGRDRFTLVTSNSVKDFDYYQKEKV